MNPVRARVPIFTFLACSALAGALASPAATASPYEADAGFGAPNQPGGAPPAEQPYGRRVPASPVKAAALPAAFLGGTVTPQRTANTYVVTTDADTGATSLRAAIAAANTNPGTDLITFAIPGGGVRTIRPATQLPTITQPVVIDGTTQSGYAGTPLIEIDGSLMPQANGLFITGGNSTVRGLIINRFRSTGGAGFGILLDVQGGNVIEGNWIGINAAGTAAAGNAGNGIAVFGSSGGNLIGGTAPGAGNLVSGNGSSGIAFASGNVGGNIARGNWVGLNAAGTAAVPNAGNGIFTNAPNCLIGGTVPGSRNIVSGNTLPGIFIGFAASSTIIQGNWVGTNAAGTDDLGNAQNGINIDQANNTTIGGNTAEARNVIAGNEFPNIYVFGPATGTMIHGNYIGTDETGTVALGDGNAVVFDNAANNQLGGSGTSEGNLISGHMPNTAVVIVGAGATGNLVRGNRIGTNAAGTAALPNFKGILVVNAAANVIGGTTAGDRNLISGNETYGIEFRNANNSRASGNYVGTDVTGMLDLGNKLHGVVIIASNDTIGGITQDHGNWIAFNGRAGVFDSTGTNNLIRFNKLWENQALGIDLFPRGIVANDSLDNDAGANGGQNFPIMDSTTVVNGMTRIHGRLDSGVSGAYTLDFYASAGPDTAHFGEGKEYIGSMNVATDATGRAPFVYDPGLLIPEELFVAATATDANGSTSEFSQTLCLADLDKDGIRDCWETPGWPIDINSDGIYELDMQALGANPNYVDVFVEVDAMSGLLPPLAALLAVQQAFTNLPASYLEAPAHVQGIRLWPQVSDTAIALRDFPGDFVAAFHAVKDTFFGTQLERTAPNAVWVRKAREQFYRYCLYARTIGPSAGLDTTNSGWGEGSAGDGGDDFLVTLGSTVWQGVLTVRHHAGTFMHELGHTLGLKHGGADHINYKPNFFSVMNYTWQMPSTWTWPGTWRLDYSRAALPSLDENNLNENSGLGAPAGVWPPIHVPFTDPAGGIGYALLSPGAKADWTQDGSFQTGRQVDINLVGEDSTVTNPGQVLAGRDEWANLVVNFRQSPNYTPAAGPLKTQASTEVTPVEELDFEIFQRLQNLPLPQPEGVFVMDGQLDPEAMLVGSNAGLNLYAALRPGDLGTQLYLAADGAVAGRDQIVLVAGTPGSLGPAPLGKAGQVAGWAALLERVGIGSAAQWRDGTGTPFEQVAIDSAGAFLEGVVQLDLLLGEVATSCAVALGSYGGGPGGALLGQVPAGDGDGDLEADEWITLSTSSVDVPRGGEPPATGGIALSNALPNPATGPTRVRLTLPAAMDVRVTVQNVAGRTVATLARSRMAAGTHELVWNRDERGRRMSPGVYFIVVEAGGETRSTRVVVLD